MKPVKRRRRRARNLQLQCADKEEIGLRKPVPLSGQARKEKKRKGENQLELILTSTAGEEKERKKKGEPSSVHHYIAYRADSDTKGEVAATPISAKTKMKKGKKGGSGCLSDHIHRQRRKKRTKLLSPVRQREKILHRTDRPKKKKKEVRLSLRLVCKASRK